MSGDYRYCACGDPSIDHRPGCAFCDCREFRERMTDPAPATPDEAVDILATVIGMRTGTRYDGVPDRSRDLATMFLADLAADGWTLSRQQGDTVAARVEDVAMVERLVSLGYWVGVGRAYDAPVRACVYSEEEDADATAEGPTIEAALRDLVAYVERPCACGHAWASHQPEYADHPVWASYCTHRAADGCGRWEDPEPRREPIPVSPGQVDMGTGADAARASDGGR